MNSELTNVDRVMGLFDLDGTLIPEPSLEMRLFTALRRDGKIPSANYFRWGLEAVRLLPQGFLAVQHNNKRYLTGVCCDLAAKYLEPIAFFEEGVARIEWHVRAGHEIVLLTGTLEPLARLAATALECELEARGVCTRLRILATKLEEEHGCWTGRIIGDRLFGEAKAHVVEKLAEAERIDLRQCHGYGNSLTDRSFLSSVGHAHVVNAGRDLAAVANEKNWGIWHWYLERKLDAQENTHVAAGVQQLGEGL